MPRDARDEGEGEGEGTAGVRGAERAGAGGCDGRERGTHGYVERVAAYCSVEQRIVRLVFLSPCLPVFVSLVSWWHRHSCLCLLSPCLFARAMSRFGRDKNVPPLT